MTETGTRGDPSGSTGQGKLDEAKETAQQATQQAREQAGQATQQARHRASGMVDERSTQAGERVSQQADDIRTVAQQLREQGKEGPAKVAEQAADRTQRVGSYLRDSDADRILGDVERMARDNPWAVMIGGAALGFVASRFLKASSRQRFETSGGGQRQIPRTTRQASYGGRFETPDRQAAPADTAGVGTGSPSAGSPVGSL
jgi:uncharacterized protein YjbJ (UPF0337 family)